ncbi:DUF2505 domain-containing protein [Rhodococcus sp. Q]|uniref:DUF2505 domain-containing protein n=1 Tax=Rhodococcus sp. Q TaxID=2502252 RepID=UPI0010F85BEC|nr:DUF2505 domain-containing protein [Rhodococcus sp. Q]
MARRIPHSVSYPQSVTDVHAALTDERYWRDRIAEVGGDNARLDRIEVGDGTVSVEMTQSIPAEHLPAVVTKIRPGDLEIVRTEAWQELDGERATGTVTARVTGLPGELTGTVTLSPAGTGSTVALDGEVRVPLPLIGGKVEAVIADRIAEIFEHEDAFTSGWLSLRE